MSQLDFALREIPSLEASYLVMLSGAIDAATAIEFQSYLEELRKRGAKHFLFDMNGITFINSTGLGLLVNLADESVNQGGSFGLINVHAKIRIVFRTLGLDNFFKMFVNLNEGLQFLARDLPVEQQQQLIENSEALLQTEPERKTVQPTDKTIPLPVIASPMGVQTKIEKPPAPSQPVQPVPAQPVAQPVEAQQPLPVEPVPVAPAQYQPPYPQPQNVPPPQPMYAPPPTQIPQQQTRKTGATRIIGREKKKIAAYIAIPASLPNFGLIYTHVQGACVAVGVLAARIDPNDPQYLQKAYQMISRVNFVIADFTGADPGIIQQATFARFQLKPPKPLLGIIQGSPATLPPQWQKTSFISYQFSKEGLSRLKSMLQQTISRAMSKL